jgi:hypothetical protein
MREILTYGAYLLGLALLFAVAAAIGYVGVSLRLGLRSGRPGRLFIGIVGLLVLAGVAVVISRSNDSPVGLLIYSGIVIILLVLGWCGRIIVPEGLADD